MRRIIWIVAVVLVIFGALSAHYEVGDAVHHTEWAVRNGMPKPSFGIFVMGMLSTVAGAAMGGWLIGRRRRA